DPPDSGTGESAMRCEKARPLISAGLDGELDEIGAAQLRTHLAECIVCATERETLAATVRLLRDLPEAEPPAELRRRIGAALMDVERAAPRHRLELAWLPRPRAPGRPLRAGRGRRSPRPRCPLPVRPVGRSGPAGAPPPALSPATLCRCLTAPARPFPPRWRPPLPPRRQAPPRQTGRYGPM